MYKRYNISLKPNKTSSNKLIELSRKITSITKTYFTLNQKNCLPHLTVYSPTFPIKNRIKIKETMKSISKNVFPIKSGVKNWSINKTNYVILFYKKSETMKIIHDKIVNKIHPFREGKIREKYLTQKYQDKLEPEQIVYIKKYGFPRLYEFFHPHITLTRLTNTNKAHEVQEILGSINEITFDALALYRIGDYGVCKKLIYAS